MNNNIKIIIISFLVGIFVLGTFNLISKDFGGKVSQNQSAAVLLATNDVPNVVIEVDPNAPAGTPNTIYIPAGSVNETPADSDIRSGITAEQRAQIDQVNQYSARSSAKTGYVSLSGINEIDEASTSKTLDGMVALFFSWGIGIAVVLSILYIVFGAIQYMTTDAIGQKSEGKQKITSAIIGLILALSSWLILHEINPKLVEIKFDLSTLSSGGGEIFGGGSFRGGSGATR